MARTDGAVQVRELRLDEALQPQPTVQPVFVPGAHKKPSTALADLARLIGNFKGFVDDKEAERKKQQEAADKANWLMLADPEKARRLAEGNVPESIKRGFADADYGAATGNTFISGFEQSLMSEYDPEQHGTKFNFFEQKRRELAGAMPTPESRVAFFAATDSAYKKYEQADTAMRTEEAAIAQINQGYNAMEAVYRSAVDNGSTPQQAIDQVYKWANEQVGVQYDRKRVNFMFLEMAKAAAERGDTEVVEALRNQPRLTKDGPIVLGNIVQGQVTEGGKVVSFRDEFDRLLAVSEQNRERKRASEMVDTQLKYDAFERNGDVDALRTEMKRFDANPALDPEGINRGELVNRIRRAEERRLINLSEEAAKAEHQAGMDASRAAIRSAIQADSFTSLLGLPEEIPSDKPNGKPIQISDEDRRKMAVEEVDAMVADYAKREADAGREVSPVQLMQMKIGMLGRNAIVDQRIKNQLDTIGSRVANYKEGQAAARDITDAEVYWNITRLHPNAVDDYVTDDRSKVFLEAYVAARENQYDEQDAYRVAATAVQQSMAGGNSVAVEMADVEKYFKETEFDATATGGADGGWFFGMVGGDESPALTGQNYAMLRRQADFFLRSNIAKNPEEAIGKAVERMQKTHVNINGRLVYVGGTIDPTVAREMIDQRLKQVFDDNQGGVGGWDMDTKDYNDKVEDLTLVPVANGVGKYYVVNKNTFQLVMDKKGGPATVTVDDLRRNKAEQIRLQQQETDREILQGQEPTPRRQRSRSGPNATEGPSKQSLNSVEDKVQKANAKVLPTAYRIAEKWIGAGEYPNRRDLQKFFMAGGIKSDPVKEAWCATFVHSVLAEAGGQGTGKKTARSYLNWGKGTNDPQPGDIVVLKRGNKAWQGHVGFFAGFDKDGNIRVLGGNQDNKVSIKSYDKRRLLGFRTAA